MQMVKWQPPVVSSVLTPASHFQHVPDTDWSTLEIKFSPPTKRVPAPCSSPPIAFMAAAGLGLPTSSTPKVCLPGPINGSRVAITASADASIVKPWMSVPPTPGCIEQDLNAASDTPEDDMVSSTFVAAKLPHFCDIDPFDLAIPSTLDVRPSKYDQFESPSQPTRCTLYHVKDNHDDDGASLNTSQSLRSCEEGRMPGLVHSKSVDPQAFALDVNWSDEPVVDWPYDALGHWIDDPVLDWNGKAVADWVDEPIDDLDDLVMIEHDAEPFDWTFLSEHRALSNSGSAPSSVFSSMEVLALPLRDSFMEDKFAYEEPVRELAEYESAMCRVSKSAWESESDFCIPAFF